MSLLLGLAARLGWKVWGVIAAVLAVLALLGAVRQSGRLAERAAQASLNAKVKDAQLKAAARRPRTDDELDRRLRDGEF